MPQLIREEVVVDGVRAVVKEHRLAGPYGLREERIHWLDAAPGRPAGTVTRRTVTGVPGRRGSFEILIGLHTIPADHF